VRAIAYGAILVLATAGAGGAAQQARPDLVQGKVSSPPTTVGAGASFKLSDLVRNRGGVPARRSTTRYFLGTVRIGGRRVAALRPGQASTGSAIVKIPSDTKAGTYRVRVCADAAKQVKETREGNNCRAADRPLTVTDFVPPPPPPPPPLDNGG
jgi:subtilase family serine protease